LGPAASDAIRAVWWVEGRTNSYEVRQEATALWPPDHPAFPIAG
jgi:hypothetical protein